MTDLLEEALATYKRADLLYSRQEVEAALDHMADALSAAFADKNPILLCVMLGGLVPTGKLLSRLDFPLEIDYIHATRYRGETRGGQLHWLAKPGSSLRDRSVVLIDDILDEGLTLAAIHQACEKSGAKEVYSAVLVQKMHDRNNNYSADFIGLQVEDRYVFGYGMDYKGYLRNVPGIYAVKENG